jgi:hypothetical protein
MPGNNSDLSQTRIEHYSLYKAAWAARDSGWGTTGGGSG